jgi:surfactin synthase thioesterase subunit
MDSKIMTNLLVGFEPKSSTNTALVCIPWAGAGAAPFRSWAPTFSGVAAVYGVRFPGRESYLEIPPIREFKPLVRNIVHSIDSLGDRPVVLFGHCSGALIAFEAARLLGQRISGLVVASQLPPTVWTDSSDSGLDRYLAPEVCAEPEMKEMAVEVLRADAEALSTYSYEPGELHIPITVYYGENDPEITGSHLLGWATESSSRTQVFKVATANHLFHGLAWVRLAELIRVELDQLEQRVR